MRTFLCLIVLFTVAGCHAQDHHKRGKLNEAQNATLRAITAERTLLDVQTNEVVRQACAAIGATEAEMARGECRIDRATGDVWYEKPKPPDKGKK